MSTTIPAVAARPLPHSVSDMDDWNRVASAQHSVLIEGQSASIHFILMLLEPYLRRPVLWLGTEGRLALPDENCGALVLQDVSALDRREQARLLAWLDGRPQRTQVVSTTTAPLSRLVKRGTFDATLYYRLNVVRLFADEGQLASASGVLRT
jgi:hypothetical protein